MSVGLCAFSQDVQYADIDHLSERRDFTIDDVAFAGLSQYFQGLRDGGMRTIIILVSHPDDDGMKNGNVTYICWRWW